jgi:hypothetical protein
MGAVAAVALKHRPAAPDQAYRTAMTSQDVVWR